MSMRVWLVVMAAASVGLLATSMTAAPARGEELQRILEQEDLPGGVLLVSGTANCSSRPPWPA